MKLTPGDSHYVLQSLILQGSIRPALVEKTLRGRENEIRSLRERLASLEGAVAAAGPRRRGPGRPRGSAKPAARTRRRISPKVRALRRLQGKYMGLVRGLKTAEKARVRAVREKQGMGAAIALASSLGSKG